MVGSAWVRGPRSALAIAAVGLLAWSLGAWSTGGQSTWTWDGETAIVLGFGLLVFGLATSAVVVASRAPVPAATWLAATLFAVVVTAPIAALGGTGGGCRDDATCVASRPQQAGSLALLVAATLAVVLAAREKVRAS